MIDKVKGKETSPKFYKTIQNNFKLRAKTRSSINKMGLTAKGKFQHNRQKSNYAGNKLGF